MVGAGSHSDPWDPEVREYAMNLDCKVGKPTANEIRTTLERVQDDPMYTHYSPCELAVPLARQLLTTFLLPHGEIVLELTEHGYNYLEGARK
jgi:hypothetical protein